MGSVASGDDDVGEKFNRDHTIEVATVGGAAGSKSATFPDSMSGTGSEDMHESAPAQSVTDIRPDRAANATTQSQDDSPHSEMKLHSIFSLFR